MNSNYKELERIMYSMSKSFKKNHDSMCCKISVPEFQTMLFMKDSKEEVTASLLSKMFNITLGGVMHILTTLIENKYIEKTILDDKRKKAYKLTKEGLEYMDSINKEKEKNMLRLVEFLGDNDSKEFIRILTRINEFMEGKNEK